MKLLEYVPLWGWFVGVVTLVVISIECGFRMGDRNRRTGDEQATAPLGAMVAATLGLLAFLLTFTFNIAASRFDDRRVAIIDDANAIGTTFLRADFLDEPARSRVQNLLREYSAVRVNGITDDADEQVIPKSESLQHKLWVEAANAGRAHPDSPLYALFVSSLNEMIDVHSKRITLVLHARVPEPVWVGLIAVTVLSMAGVGYYCGLEGKRSWLETTVLVSTFGVVMLLVADLDRPHEGLLKTSQQPMVDLCRHLHAP